MQSGRYFIGLDTLGDTTGFSFTVSGTGEVKTMGDEVADSANLLLRSALPQKAHLIIFKNGEKFADENDAVEFTFKPNGPGEYRAEAYLETLSDPFDKMPWIISNPIYVK